MCIAHGNTQLEHQYDEYRSVRLQHHSGPYLELEFIVREAAADAGLPARRLHAQGRDLAGLD